MVAAVAVRPEEQEDEEGSEGDGEGSEGAESSSGSSSDSSSSGSSSSSSGSKKQSIRLAATHAVRGQQIAHIWRRVIRQTMQEGLPKPYRSTADDDFGGEWGPTFLEQGAHGASSGTTALFRRGLRRPRRASAGSRRCCCREADLGTDGGWCRTRPPSARG